MYENITGVNPYENPMQIYPAIHYTMGGLWVDYNLMSNLPGLFVLGEANFSDHGANRLGASALMQGLADGYFILPYTIGGYFAGTQFPAVSAGQAEFREVEQEAAERIRRLLAAKGSRTVDEFHRDLGLLMWNQCGMARNEKGLRDARARIPALREEFWRNVTIPGSPGELNQVLEHAGRVADFLEFAELLLEDALTRKESCGGHFREEYQTPEGECLRDDENFSHVSAWEYAGAGAPPVLHREPLVFEHVKPSRRDYK
jgi:succinate dehydrogenase / fumarate reductase flavoprotein subunit